MKLTDWEAQGKPLGPVSQEPQLVGRREIYYEPGQQVNGWLVLQLDVTGCSPTKHLCRCTYCGKTERPVSQALLKNGQSKSCGCRVRTQNLPDHSILHKPVVRLPDLKIYGSQKEAGQDLNTKSESQISAAIQKQIRVYGYQFMRLADWEAQGKPTELPPKPPRQPTPMIQRRKLTEEKIAELLAIKMPCLGPDCSKMVNLYYGYREKGGKLPKRRINTETYGGLTVKPGIFCSKQCARAFATQERHANGLRGCNQRGRMLPAFQEVKLISEWLRDSRCEASRGCLYQRLQKGWDPERAITTPMKRRKQIRATTRQERNRSAYDRPQEFTAFKQDFGQKVVTPTANAAFATMVPAAEASATA